MSALLFDHVDVECPVCHQRGSGLVLTNCYITVASTDSKPVIWVARSGAVHIHGRDILPFGGHTIRATLRRELPGIARRFSHKHGRSLAAAGLISVASAAALAAVGYGAIAWFGRCHAEPDQA